MQIKVFKASSMREAVAQMKQELGENAVILHTKKYKDGGFLGMGSREMIELTAAIEDEKPLKKELPTEKLETKKSAPPPPVAVRSPSVVSQYKTSGTPEGVIKAEMTPPLRAAESLRTETAPAIAEPMLEPTPKPMEPSVENSTDYTFNMPNPPTPIEPSEEESPQRDEPVPVSTVKNVMPEPQSESAASEILAEAMNLASSAVPEPQQEPVSQSVPLPSELTNLTADPKAIPLAVPVKSEQLTSVPPVTPPKMPPPPPPSGNTVTLTTEQLAQMQAAMVAQTMAQFQMTPNVQPQPQVQPSSNEQPKSEAATADASDKAKEADIEEKTEAERAGEEKIKRLENEIAQMKAMLAKVLGRDVTRGTMSLHEALRQQEVNEEILNDMAVSAGAGETLADSQSIEARMTLVNYLQASMLFTEGIKLNRHGVRIVALLGTTGVGKTTTLAKIAAKFVLEHQVSAALITADTYRISAVEQLRTYSDILGLPLEIVYTPVELSKAIMKHRTKDLILIDTAGRSQYNDTQLRELQELLSINQRIEKHLVLSVTTKQSDARDIIEKFAVCEPDKVIFTKSDETSSIGLIMNLLVKQQRLGLSYLTNGQSVPDDIIAATPDSLADLILRN